MSSKICGAITILALLISVKHATAYNAPSGQLGASGSRICSDPGVHTQTWTITPPYAANTGGHDVRLDFNARADLDASDELIDVSIAGTAFVEDRGGPPLGHLFASGGNTGCNFDPEGGTSGTAVYHIDADDWNALLDSHSGEMEFFFSTPSTVQCLACTDGCKCGAAFEHPFSWVSVEVTYTEYESECTSGASCDDGFFCTIDDECTEGLCAGGGDYQCATGQACDELNDSCEQDCNGNAIPDAYEFPSQIIKYDSSSLDLPDEASPPWSEIQQSTVPGVISNGLLVVNDPGDSQLAYYKRDSVFTSSTQSAVFETTGQADRKTG